MAIATTQEGAYRQGERDADNSGVPLESEIERLQRTHNLNRVAPGLALVVGLVAFVLTETFEDWICAMMILVAALVPIQIWSRRHVLGIPVWPVVAFLSFVVYGLPYITGHPLTKEYTGAEKLTAAATIAGVLLITTLLWAALARTRRPMVVLARIIPTGSSTRLFLFFIAIATGFQLNAVMWIFDIPSEIFGVLRAILFSLAIIALFSLSYDAGRGLLKRFDKYAYIGLLVGYVLANMLTLYLYISMQIAFIALLGFYLGGGRPPWKAIAVVMLAFSLLQAGKPTLRNTYWGAEGQTITSLSGAVLFFKDWFVEGFQNMFAASEPVADSLIHRGSVTHMVLRAQTESPATVPFMYGTTYLMIPQLLIPRFIWAERPTTHDALRQLNMHYGLLTLDETETTSIAWGLIAEAFANFGFVGCVGLAIVLGVTLGIVQRWCGRFPIKSARGLLALLVVSCMVNLEANSATLLTTFVQSTVALVLLALVAMQKRRVVG